MGGYTSPDWDNGDLTGGQRRWLSTYTYAMPDGRRRSSTIPGYQVQATSADGFAVVTRQLLVGQGVADADARWWALDADL